MESKSIIAIAAGTGGIAPSLVYLAQGFIKENLNVPGIIFFVGVAIFFILGAMVAIFFDEKEAKKAFFLGIGLPALIATAQTQEQGKINKFTSINFISSAYAQESMAPSSATKKIQQELNLKYSDDCKQCEIWFFDSKGEVIAKKLLNSEEKSKNITVPKGASNFGIADPKSNFTLVPIPRNLNTDTTIEFERKYNPLKDFRRGLGNYDLKSYDAKIKIDK